MAGKKPEKPKMKKSWESKPVAVQVRGSEEYKAAIEEFAESEGKSVAAMVDHAIRLYVRQAGYAKLIPKR